MKYQNIINVIIVGLLLAIFTLAIVSYSRPPLKTLKHGILTMEAASWPDWYQEYFNNSGPWYNKPFNEQVNSDLARGIDVHLYYDCHLPYTVDPYNVTHYDKYSGWCLWYIVDGRMRYTYYGAG